MNGAQLHLLTNHIAVIGVPLGAFLLAWGLLRGSRALRTAGLVVLVLVSVGGVVAYFSGEPAEHVVEAYGVSGRTIHPHEEFAEKTFVVTDVLAVLALVALVMLRKRPDNRLWPTLTLGLALVTAGMLAWTAHLGGEIRHPEIRLGDRATPPDAAEAAAPRPE